MGWTHHHQDFRRLRAEVIKIETGTVDARQWQVRHSFQAVQYQQEECHAQPGTPKGKELAKKIVAWADIVAENMTAGAMKRMV